MKPVLYISSREADVLDLGRFPNAGPHPDVCGMRRIYARARCCNPSDVLLVSDRTYLYHVDAETYYGIREGSIWNEQIR